MRGSRALGLLCVLTSACSYDWSYAPPDAGPDASGGGVDASIDAAMDAAPPDAAPDVPGDGPASDSSPDCPAIHASVQQARAQAVACNGTAQSCETLVTDECSCQVVVGGALSDQVTQNYLNAIQAAKSSGCALDWCAACGPTPNKGLCVVADAGTSALACFQ